MNDEMAERLAIRELLENWVMWRDQGAWDRFRTCWHADAQMLGTWFKGTADQFIQASKQAFDRGITILHFLGGSTIEVARQRAFSQTKVTISQRAPIEGVVCDVACDARFCDLLEKRDGRWGIVSRRLIYERDRLDPVEPGKTVPLDKALLEQFPEGYRHLAYLQSKAGLQVRNDLAGNRGPAAERIYALGAAWLAHQPVDL
jgi:hypothetical protein